MKSYNTRMPAVPCKLPSCAYPSAHQKPFVLSPGCFIANKRDAVREIAIPRGRIIVSMLHSIGYMAQTRFASPQSQLPHCLSQHVQAFCQANITKDY